MSPDSGTPASTPTLRAARPADADAAGLICYRAFKNIAEQHKFPPDFPDPDTAIGLIRYLVARTDVHGVVAELGGRIVGSNFLWKDDMVAGVGPITIDLAAQDGGIGRKLMQAVIDHARASGIGAVRLVQAAYHGRSLSLYTKLGFAARESLSVMQGPVLAIRLEGCSVRAAHVADIEAANALCRRVHGHSRSAELGAATEQGTARVVERTGRITGYTTSVGFLGHAVAETTEDLQALIGAAPSFPGPGFLMPTRNADLMRWCLEHGLRIVQPMTLTTGPYQEPQGAYLPSILY